LSFSIILSFAISIVYLGFGIFLIVGNNIFVLSRLQRLGFGLVLLAYGLFRFYRTLKKKRESDIEDDEE
jgi:hypothetical protein